MSLGVLSQTLPLYMVLSIQTNVLDSFDTSILRKNTEGNNTFPSVNQPFLMENGLM